jgi:hypothetical protein
VASGASQEDTRDLIGARPSPVTLDEVPCSDSNLTSSDRQCCSLHGSGGTGGTFSTAATCSGGTSPREDAGDAQGLEWEEDGSGSGPEDTGLSGLFGAGPDDDVVLDAVEVWGLGRVPMEVVSAEQRHTLRQTGLMRWTAAPAFANLVSACPALTRGGPLGCPLACWLLRGEGWGEI